MALIGYFSLFRRITIWMELSIELTEHFVLNFEEGSTVIPLRIEVEGEGRISVCSIRLYNGDEESMEQHKEIIFVVSDHPGQNILTPVTSESICSYRYGVFKIFKGLVAASCKSHLVLNEQKRKMDNLKELNQKYS
jgi:hypothetical protein